jgi:hypothetical protein
MRAQAQLILSAHADTGAAAFPAADRWDDVDSFDYLYRENAILVREPDVARVTTAITQILNDAGNVYVPAGPAGPIQAEPVGGAVVRLTVPATPTLVPEILAGLDRALGPGVAKPDHKLYVCPFTCPATEPTEVASGLTQPVPAPGLDAGCRRHGAPWPGNDGDGVSVVVVDTGWIPAAATGHPWLAGVDGTHEDPYTTDANGATVLTAYAGHGTFVAGVLRCLAPKASVFVERAFNIAGADYETMLLPSLENALSRDPDILVFTFASATHRNQSLHTFDLSDRRIRHITGLAVLAPAGNDGTSQPAWPAAHHGVIGVGALAADWRTRAGFSNYGRWVDVYAPGEDLVNAYPDGTYVCKEPPNVDDRRQFRGLAGWSGTSFSTPVLAGLIAARMSVTGQNAQQAADSLLRFAGSQAIPGVGPVLYPGQAACEAGRCEH